MAPLDGLRGIAILLVVWYHVWQITWLPAPLRQLEFLPETGFAGVDLFFFISGFVISYPFVKARLLGTPQPGWRHFAYRRFIKIVPSYALSIAVLVTTAYAHFASPADAVEQLAAHLLFVHTWWSSTFGAINGVLWSLAVEVQFYVLFPLVWWSFRRSAILTTIVMTTIALAYRIFASHCCLRTTSPQLIDNLPGYLDIFAAGMIAAFTYVRLQARADGPRWSVPATTLAFAGVAMFWLLSQNLYDNRLVDMWPATWEFVYRSGWGVAFYCIAIGTLHGAGWWQRIVSNPLLLVCGAVSFNWYLYHQVVARALLAAHIPPFSTMHAVDDPRWQAAFTVVAIIVSFLQAAVVTFAFERPLLALDPAAVLAGFRARIANR